MRKKNRTEKIDGYSVHQILQDAWLNVIINEKTLYNPLESIPDICSHRPELYFSWLLTRPEYLGFAAKVLLNINLAPFQVVILQQMWTHKFPMLIGSRGCGKTFILAVYALLRALLIPNRKVVIVGSVFRQSKLVFNYIKTIYDNSPILRSIIKDEPHFSNDRCHLTLGSSKVTALPIGSGDKIRGERSSEILADEFASQSKEIFETVIAGFGAVSADPINQVKLKASQVFANHLGIELEDDTDEYDGIGNQIILSGTAYYHFNHFAQYWEKWKQIIHSKGEKKKLQTIFGDQEIDEDFNWKDYCVTRLPAILLPPGFMDASQLARSKATLPSDTYQLEFEAIFSKDSNGFFKASLLEKCTANEENDITHPSGRIVFEAKVKGDKGKEYVIGVDPASEQDRFAVVVLELHQDHRRIVHVWTTNSEEFKAKRKAGIIEENDFYGYTARKIRDLMILFPCVHLAIDSQGGGKAVYEALHDTTKLKEGEHPLWEVIEEGKNKDSDGEEGLHIVEMVNFASAEYTTFANHSMKKDFEDRLLLFPRFNPAVSAVAAAMNKINMREDSNESINGVRLYDSYEDAIEEIEELKKELSQIVITRTASGRERWDTPDIKISGTEKGKMRKDRYSALVMANAAARKMSGPNYIPRYDVMGLMNKQEEGHGRDFIGPAWITNQLNDLYS
jgi:hypothetical protein